MRIDRTKLIAAIDIDGYYRNHISGKIQSGENGWCNGRCPFPDHADTNPSFGYNRYTGAFKCFGCNRSGDLIKFDQLIAGGSYRDALLRLAGTTDTIVTQETLAEKVQRYHYNLIADKDDSLTTVTRMGITVPVVRRHQLGYMPNFGRHQARMIFPIFDEHGTVITLKKYSRQAPAKRKSKFEKGGKVSLYGIHQIPANQLPIVICAGEKDKCIGESILGENFLFVTFTGGESALPQGEQWQSTRQALQDKPVIICYDADQAGHHGAQKLAQALTTIAKKITIVHWPLSFSQQCPKGDLSDFLLHWPQGGKQPMIELLANAPISDPTPLPAPNYRSSGNISETPSGYHKTLNPATTIPISNFIIRPRQRLWIDGKEAVAATLIHCQGEYQVILERQAWHTRQNFLKQIASIDLAFTGNELDLQHIQAIVADYQVPTRKGSRLLGYHHHDGAQHFFLLPDRIIADHPQPDTVYIPESGGSHPLLPVFQPRPQESDHHISAFLNQLLPQLINLHHRPPLAILIGWLFATPFKPQLHQTIGHFPILNIYGTRGSGKSSLALLLWRLFGFSGEIFSCTQSRFSWLKLLAATNAYPLFFDEYKPWDMSHGEVQKLHRLVRRVYIGEIESRGKPDQTLVQYRLQAPIAIIGEVSFQEPALLERILPVPLSFQELTTNHRQTYAQIKALPLTTFLIPYLQWTLSQDSTAIWADIHHRHQSSLNQFSDRVSDNIKVALFGLACYRNFAQAHQIAIPKIDEQAVIALCATELCGEVDGGRLAVDILLEKLAYLAESGILIKDRDYRVAAPLIYLRLEPCLDKFKEWASKVHFANEILDAKAYRQMFKERQDSYVVELGKKMRIGYGCYRCVAVDSDQARQIGIVLDGFLGHGGEGVFTRGGTR